MPDIYEMKYSHEVKKVLEEMRVKLANNFGVTVNGNRCTVRWEMNKQLVHVHMIISDVKTPSEAIEDHERHERMEALCKKYPDLSEKLYFVEHGEWSK